MASALIFLIILFLIPVAGIAVAAIVIFAYRRRVNKVAKGEIRDTHNPIPTPETTVNGVYKIVLIILVGIALLNTITLHSKLIDMQHSINNLRITESELYMLRDIVEQSAKRVAYAYCEFSDLNPADRTGKIHITAALKEYSEDTALTLHVGGQSIPFDRIAPGTYDATFTADLFAPHTEAALHIMDGGKTVAEPFDDFFPEWIFWEYLPMPGMQSELHFEERFGKVRYQGDYYICAEHLDDIEAVSVTYLTGGRELKTIDVTKETLNHERITLEQGLPLEQDMTFRIEVVTKSGFKIVDQALMFGGVGDPDTAEFRQIQDLDGNILFDVRFDVR